MKFLHGSWKVFKKDLIYEFGSWEILSILLVFSLAVLFLFNFSFELSPQDAESFLPGFLWLTILFASVLGFSRVIETEKQGGGMEGVLLSPIPKEAIFTGKICSSFLFLLVVELILTPAFFLFLGVKLSLRRFELLLFPLSVASLGLTVIGTFLANIAYVAKHSGILFSLGYFPLVVPILISATKISQGILQTNSIVTGPWVKFLIVINIIYIVVCILLFEYLIEE